MIYSCATKDCHKQFKLSFFKCTYIKGIREVQGQFTIPGGWSGTGRHSRPDRRPWWACRELAAPRQPSSSSGERGVPTCWSSTTREKRARPEVSALFVFDVWNFLSRSELIIEFQNKNFFDETEFYSQIWTTSSINSQYVYRIYLNSYTGIIITELITIKWFQLNYSKYQ